MLVVMKMQAEQDQIDAVVERIRELGLVPHPIPGATRTAIGITGNRGPEHRDTLVMLPGVEDVIVVTAPYKLVSREVHPESTTIPVADTEIGGGFTIIGGPCSVENEEMIIRTARFLIERGVKIIPFPVAKLDWRRFKSVPCGDDLVGLDGRVRRKDAGQVGLPPGLVGRLFCSLRLFLSLIACVIRFLTGAVL